MDDIARVVMIIPKPLRIDNMPQFVYGDGDEIQSQRQIIVTGFGVNIMSP